MKDELVSALLPEVGLRAVGVSAGTLSRYARELHQAQAASATLFTEALVGALLLASLQEEKQRVNVQLECGGPLRGLFADAGSDGTVRGYIKNPHLAMVGDSGTFAWRPVLGNSGFISVLRELSAGEFYRSSIELEAFDFAQDFERYFKTSEQIETRVFIHVRGSAQDAGERAIGLLLQPLPDGSREALNVLAGRLQAGAFEAAARSEPASVAALLVGLLGTEQGPVDVMGRYPVSYQCTCSQERVYRALVALGKEELRDVLAKDGRAEATCEFCNTRYVVESPELIALLERMDASTPA